MVKNHLYIFSLIYIQVHPIEAQRANQIKVYENTKTKIGICTKQYIIQREHPNGRITFLSDLNN